MDTLNLKITITKMKNSTDGIDRTLARAKGKTIKLEDRVFKNNQTETQRKKKQASKTEAQNRPQETRTCTEWPTIFVSLESQKEKREQENGTETIFKETTAEHFPN